jgi:hypothetical protein
MMCSRLVRTHAADGDHIHAADGFADDREGVVPHLPVRDEVIGPDEIAGIDVGLRHELVDVDGAGRLQGDVLKLVLRHFDVGVGIDFVALGDVFGGDFLAGIGVDLHVFDAVAGVPVDLVEADLLGLGRGRVQSDRTGDERKAEEAFPVGAGGHGYSKRYATGSRFKAD